MIAIVDYGMGNLGSIMNMMRRLDILASITRNPADIEAAERIIIPGVGAFDQGMRAIIDHDLKDVILRNALEHRKPIIGLCLGMQLLLEKSEEGQSAGLALVQGDVRRLRPAADVRGRTAKVPHMGWNYATPVRAHPLFEGADAETRFYFVHSYAAVCAFDHDVLAASTYGGQTFATALACRNVAGVQFHPEKSHRFGMRLLRNFASWDPAS